MAEYGLGERPSDDPSLRLHWHKPAFQNSFKWKQLSAISGLSFWQLYFRLFLGAIHSEQAIQCLGTLGCKTKRSLLSSGMPLPPPAVKR